MDLMKLIQLHLSEDGEEFDAKAERSRLQILLDCKYVKFIYGSRVLVHNQHSSLQRCLALQLKEQS